ncbi:PTS sugar transporter subunit IIB [Proteiniclasticum sp.]|uniref:PTS sugar transporter subunit IIB n=1 Tax=Proteiniclasticum sp. TaxID=2053595 RepID=UPI0028A28352|nr:PTS sugar transporter subunit IIB [Proteiniclasticum sp.]
MMKILLVCSAGMSTSLLVTKMKKAADEKGIDVEIFALSAGEGKKILKDVDLVLLGPQVRFMKNEFLKLATVPVDVIDMLSYGRMEGDKVLNHALTLLEQKQ